MAEVSKKVTKEKSVDSLAKRSTLVGTHSSDELVHDSELVEVAFAPPARVEQNLAQNGKTVSPPITITVPADASTPLEPQGDLAEEASEASTDGVAYLREGLALFELLDKEHRETLGRREARNWFRGLGWCIDENALDALLDGVPTPRAPDGRSAPRSPGSPNRSPGSPRPAASTSAERWAFPQLLELAQQHRLEGPDADALSTAIRDIVAGLSFVTREFLRKKVVECDVGVTEADVDEILELCGYPGEFADPAQPLDTNLLVQHMAHAICHPRDHAQRGARAGGAVRQAVGGRS